MHQANQAFEIPLPVKKDKLIKIAEGFTTLSYDRDASKKKYKAQLKEEAHQNGDAI